MTMSGYSPSIKQLLDSSGSDKGRWFGGLYEVLLQPCRHQIQSVIEIGIGTLIPDAPSSMVGYAAETYKPGASLRSWRDFLPNAHIHGFDVAPDTQLTGESRISTYLCDSTDPDQTAAILARLSGDHDMIIDDGLHTRDSQIATLRNFYPALRPGGLYIIEDVHPRDATELVQELERLEPACPSFVHLAWVDWYAIVGRKPLRGRP